jgi:transposase
MRQVHRAGEKLFVDYSGKKPCIIDPKTGEVHEVELFVAVLGASNYTYAEATRTQKSSDWIASHIRALEFLGRPRRARARPAQEQLIGGSRRCATRTVAICWRSSRIVTACVPRW